MKRAFYEWSVILFAAISMLGIAYWGVSLVSDVGDFELAIGRGSSNFHFQMIAYDGRLLFCDHFANLEVIEAIDSGRGFEPKPTSNISWRVPGLEFHHVGFADGWLVWSADISLMIPVLVCALLSLVCFRGFRRVTHHAMNQGGASQQ